MYPPPVSARSEEPQSELAASPPQDLDEAGFGEGESTGKTGISPLTDPNRADRGAAPPVVLVEDRLVGDRRSLPAPPSHRDGSNKGAGPASGRRRMARAVAVPRSPVLTSDPNPTDLDAVEPGFEQHGFDSGFSDLDAGDHAIDASLSLSRRVIRGGLVLGLIGAIGALMVVMPDDRNTSVETATDAEPPSPQPVATAEMLDNSARTDVEVSLGSSDSLTEIAMSGLVLRSGSPADTPDGFDGAVTDVVDGINGPDPSPSTTVFTEPVLPPESEWVDSGNGVLVPDLLLRIRFCESTNNYNAANGWSSARGAYQFLTKSWDWYGHAAITGVTQAHLATPAQQDEAALRTLQAEGTSPWAESRGCWNDPNLDGRYRTATPPPPVATTVPEDTVPGEGDETTSSTEPPETTVPDGETTTTTAPEGEPTDTTTDTTVAPTTTTVVPTTTTTTTAPPADGG